ncbi:MAG TPA: hypothetical protein VKI19_15225 [Acidimicrobiales bacterium]|nr:hypothetical protein [Acidimicrobiales bacterium]
MIEGYHKAQKTGWAIEQLPSTSARALQPMIGPLSAAGVTLLTLPAAGRDTRAATRPAAAYVDRGYVAVLSAWRPGTARPDWTVRESYWALGRLGGHQNRKSDRPPGWIVLWRGRMAPQHMLDGAEAVGVQVRGQT